MGAGYYPLGGVLARQARGQAMRNYEPKMNKKQPAIIIVLLASISLGRFSPALGGQRLLGAECLAISVSGAIFALTAHP